MPTPIPRVETLSPEAFARDHLTPGKPVIVTGALRHWPALTRWTPDYLRTAEKNLRVWVQFVPDELFHFEKGVMRYVRFSHFVELLTAPKTEPRKERAYLQGFPVAEAKALHQDVSPPGLIPDSQLKQAHLWLGGGATIPLHFDGYNTLLTQVLGRKRIRLFEPTRPCFYPYPLLSRSWQTSQVNLDAVDPIRFPHFPADEAWVGEIGPGELLFIPLFWWHQVEHEGITASISFGYGGGGTFTKLLGTAAGRRSLVRSVLEPVAMVRQRLSAKRRKAMEPG